MTIGEYVRSYRQMHGMSQRKFAALSGISNSYISVLERGTNSNGSLTTPSFETYQAIAAVTGCTVQDLIELLDDDLPVKKPAPESGLDPDLIERLRSLTPEELSKVDGFIQGLIASRG